MKISELIEALQNAKQEHGDIDVYVWPYMGQQATRYKAEHVDPVYNKKDGGTESIPFGVMINCL